MRLNTQKTIVCPDPALIQLINQIFLSLGLMLSLAKRKKLTGRKFLKRRA